MNKLLYQYQTGKKPFELFFSEVERNEFENLFDDINFISHSSRLRKYHLNVTDKNKNDIRTNCLDFDSEGKFLLSGNNDGSILLFALDDKLKNGQLFNKKIQYCKRPHSDDRKQMEKLIPQKRNREDTIRQVHSFETNRNKFRMYRQSSSLSSEDEINNSKMDDLEAAQGESHHGGITTMKWYGEDNGMFFTGSNDKIIKIWDTNQFKSVQDLEFEYMINQIDNVENNFMNEIIAVASDDYYPRLIDLKNMNLGITIFGKKTVTSHLKENSELKSEILTCKINPQRGNVICSGDADGSIKLWDLRMTNRLLIELRRFSKASFQWIWEWNKSTSTIMHRSVLVKHGR